MACLEESSPLVQLEQGNQSLELGLLSRCVHGTRRYLHNPGLSEPVSSPSGTFPGGAFCAFTEPHLTGN